jgi:cytoskeletal protein CcmA (bactofilin family)
MFSRKEEKLECLIGTNCSFEGQIDTKGTIRIDGSVNGNVNADWIIIGEHGKIQGDLSAKGAIIGGAITGNILTKESLSIMQTGKVSGDIKSNKLSIAEGGIFEGNSSLYKRESTVVDIQAKGKETG